eukprot:115323-Rhodomonas_salina.2
MTISAAMARTLRPTNMAQQLRPLIGGRCHRWPTKDSEKAYEVCLSILRRGRQPDSTHARGVPGEGRVAMTR